MQSLTIDRKATGIFSEQHSALVYDQQDLTSFLERPFEIEAFQGQMEKRASFSSEDREILSNALRRQYGSLPMEEGVDQNINALRSSNTFTITTGHQLSLLSGPLYFVIKIAHVIEMVKTLNRHYPEVTFVPVYWMATEDHDYEEIQSLELFGKRRAVDYQQRGPVGHFGLEKMASFKDEILELFQENRRSEIRDLLEAYSGNNLAEATRGLVNKLFGKHGLIVLDGDDPELKRRLIPVVKRELSEQFSNEAVLKTNSMLKKAGLKTQVTSRPVNLFYMKEGLRERIVPNGDRFAIDQVGTFTKEVLEMEAERFPERFSPNVVLRPLYQEMLLPNLAYVGGGGEISYWIQLKGVFDQVGCVYPLIQVRNSLIWIDRGTLKKMRKINLKTEDIFKSVDALKKQFVIQNAGDDLDFHAIDEGVSVYAKLLEEKILSVDGDLRQYAEVELRKLEKQLKGIREKLLKTSKGKFDQSMQIIERIKERLFPRGGLQERTMNFLNFCADGEIERWLDGLMDVLEPFGKDLIIVQEGEE